MRAQLAITGAAIAAIAPGAIAQQGIAFEDPVFVTTSGHSPKLSFARFNAEGGVDILSLAGSNNFVELHQYSNDRFDTPKAFGALTSPSELAVADFNGDGTLDAAVGSASGNRIAVMRYDFPGILTVTSRPTSGSFTSDLDAGDIDNDGDRDIVCAVTGTNQLAVLFNDGLGDFSESTLLLTGGQPVGVRIGDLNGDGDTDLVACNYQSNSVSVFLNQGSGVFAPAFNVPCGSRPGAVTIGDFTRDGLTDILVVNQSIGAMTLLPGLGNGQFGPSQLISAGLQPSDLITVDIDQDGDDDAIAALGQQDRFILLENTENGPIPRIVDLVEPQSAVSAGDFNGDGMPDLAFSLTETNRIAILENLTPPPTSVEPTPCPADCDGNERVEFGDLICTLFRFGQSGTLADGADCDGSGFVDFGDLICVLFLFGPCE